MRIKQHCGKQVRKDKFDFTQKLIQSSAITAFVFLAVYNFFLEFHQEANSETLEFRTKFFVVESSKLQTQFYIAFLILLSAVVITFVIRSNKRESKIEITKYYSNPLSTKLSLLVLLTGIYFFGQYDRWFKNGFLLTILGLLAIKIFKNSEKIHVNVYKKFILILFVGFFACFVLLPFFTTPIYANNFLPNNLFHSASSQHFAAVVVPGYNYQTGSEVGASAYGVSVLLLVSFAIKFLSFFDINNDYLLFLVVRIYQLVAIILVFVLFWLVDKKNALITASFTVLLTAYYNTIGFTNYFPNTSGLRFINFLIGLILLVLLTRRTEPNVLTYSAISSFLIFLGLETGAPVAIGIFTLYMLQSETGYKKLYELLLAAIKFFLGMFLILGLLILTTRNLNINTYNPLSVINSRMRGGGGMSGQLNVRAVFALFVSIIYLFRSFHLLNNSRTSRTTNLQGSVAAITISFLYFYITRMDQLNLIFIPIPIMVMFSPYFGKNMIKLVRARNKAISLMACVTISFFGGLAASNSNALYSEIITKYKPFFRSDCTLSIKISQKICDTSGELTNMSDYFSEARLLGNSEEAIFLSIFPAEVKLNGFNKNFPYNSLVWDLWTNKNRVEFIEWINAKPNQIQYIFVDKLKPDSGLDVVFFHSLVRDSDFFEIENSSYYWEKYRKVNPSN